MGYIDTLHPKKPPAPFPHSHRFLILQAMRTVWMILLGTALLAQGCTYYFSNSWARSFAKGGDQPYLEMGNRPDPLSDSLNAVLGKELLQDWADQTHIYNNWLTSGKVGVPRVVLANLMLGQHIDSTNLYIQTLVPWGNAGSTWALHKRGDYDFTQIILADILMRFKDRPEVLYPATVRHIANVLITDIGTRPATKTPRTFRLMSDTENHILMREISRYLHLEYRRSIGQADTSISTLEGWLQKHLEEMLRTGFYEFNAQPYIGYTITALQVLYNHAGNPQLKLQAQQLLDKAHLDYVLGSYALRRYPAYRRRMNYATKTEFAQDPHTAIMQVLLWKYENEPVRLKDLPHARHQAIMAWTSEYQLPDTLYKMITGPRQQYIALLGHGKKASPEIYSGGQGYLISSGGVQRGKQSQLVARPIVLLANDNIGQLDGVIYLMGKGPMKRWNNTGVWDRFAVSNGGAYVPDTLQSLAEGNGWVIVSPDSGLLVAVYSQPNLGMLAVYTDWQQSPELLLAQINDLNPDPELLHHEVRLPNRELIRYQIGSRKNTWVIQPPDSLGINRKFDLWPGLRMVK